MWVGVTKCSYYGPPHDRHLTESYSERLREATLLQVLNLHLQKSEYLLLPFLLPCFLRNRGCSACFFPKEESLLPSLSSALQHSLKAPFRYPHRSLPRTLRGTPERPASGA